MRGVCLFSLALLMTVTAACAQGETGELSLGGFGGSSTATGSTGSGGKGGSDSTSTTGTATTGSTTSTSSGGVPTTCAEAHGNTGCCANNTAYYCKTGSTSLTPLPCTGSKVCGWNSSSSYYTCVAAPGGADPSNANPEACN